MRTIFLPQSQDWPGLIGRPSMERKELSDRVGEILESVKSGKDKALLRYSEVFDGVSLNDLKVTSHEIADAVKMVPEELKQAIRTASGNIERFHSSQLLPEKEVQTFPGVNCWRKSVPVEKVGLYIPGGSAPLFSTVLMLAIPARIAGCSEIILCTPPAKNGKINPVILFAAYISGVTAIFKAGGAQAIAAMAYGTESIPAVYKIFGPGNQYVTMAKELVQQDGIAIDMPAGPSEVLVISDGTADPSFIAADLLSQAEHGPDSQVVYLTDNKDIIPKVVEETKSQLALLPRRDIASKALDNSMIILLSSLEDCMGFSNLYAPEHLIINTANPDILAAKVVNAGSVFLGPWSCESAGDYASGTNHTLPTSGYARNYSGVSADSFFKKITFQRLEKDGLKNIGPVIETMAEAELLTGHKNAVSLRLKKLKND
jgi:histidinol dehydrogenase